MRQVKTLGLLGTGVIGGGWAARALHFGIDVVAADLKPEMEAWVRGAVDNAESALSRLTFAPLPPKGTLSFTTDLRAMARQVDFIQENIPEQLGLKQRVLADVSRCAPPEVIIASSTSGLLPTDLQRDMQAPERFLVAHPFNPVYLLPLVELVGGGSTSAVVGGATGGHPAPRQERSLYQPLARTDDGLGRPRCAAWRFDLARVQLGSHGTGRHACQFRENRRNGPCSL